MQTTGIEILAPVGDEAMLRAAVYSGADCVYLGARGFNARRTAANFGPQELAEAAAFCRARGCGVYAALNTLVLPGQEAALDEAVESIAAAGCDAIIVQDLHTARRVAQLAPGLALHGSTQMSVHSLEGVLQLAELGFERVILSRELSEDEIAYIASRSPVQLEVFVHGALCVCVSGQCYASAFLGGRSANRGGCAGPCRLPFRAEAALSGPATPAQQGENHLSLKDLSVLDALPRLAEMGIASAKIEGRLRGPEYVAVVVDAARRARAGEVYDKQLLEQVFSRSGFTDGWFTGEKTAAMFGVRTAANTAAVKQALPAARGLFRRELPRVPVSFSLRLKGEGGTLRASDGVHEAAADIPGPLQPAASPQGEVLRRALAKTGGTPFYAEDIGISTSGFYLPAALVNAARRDVLAQLLAKRAQAPVQAAKPPLTLAALQAPVGYMQPAGPPSLRARFASLAQMPQGYTGEATLPLAEWQAVPEALRTKIWLEIPRVLFGEAEAEAAGMVQAAAGGGFAGFAVNNVAGLRICRGNPVRGGFGLNLTNAGAVETAAALGCTTVTLSAELSLAQARRLVGSLGAAVQTDMIAYGHFPLMVTRATPLAHAGGGEMGTMADRQGKRFPVQRTGDTSEIYNPVPLWLADRLQDLPVHTATLYFTNETRAQAAKVLAAFEAGEKAKGPFTRGLYDKGTES